MPRVVALARPMAATASTLAAMTAKLRPYAEPIGPRIGQAIEDSKAPIGDMMRTADVREGVKAVQERRQPRFPGLGDTWPGFCGGAFEPCFG